MAGLLDFPGAASVWASPGVLNGCETPGVAEEMAEGAVALPGAGCRGLGGEDGVAGAAPSL